MTVDRGGELVLFAPADCEPRVLEEFVRAKHPWIYEELERKQQLRPPVRPREYVSGEGFPYLGRSYRLLLVDDQSVPLKLDEGRFKLLRSQQANGRKHLIAWYTAHAQPWFAERVDRFAGHVGVKPVRIVVRELGYRWGSCAKDGSVFFHWRSILLPPRSIEYVVLPELLHLQEPLHSRPFWLRMQAGMPDYRSRKQWLAENGHQATAV